LLPGCLRTALHRLPVSLPGLPIRLPGLPGSLGLLQLRRRRGHEGDARLPQAAAAQRGRSAAHILHLDSARQRQLRTGRIRNVNHEQFNWTISINNS
jgi:hypothetical protein